MTIDVVVNHTTSDHAMRNLLDMTEEGFPNNIKDMPEEIREYHKYRDNISSRDGVLRYKQHTKEYHR